MFFEPISIKNGIVLSTLKSIIRKSYSYDKTKAIFTLLGPIIDFNNWTAGTIRITGYAYGRRCIIYFEATS